MKELTARLSSFEFSTFFPLDRGYAVLSCFCAANVLYLCYLLDVTTKYGVEYLFV